METDFCLSDFGSLFILTPISMAADEWCIENVQSDMTWGKGLVISYGCIEAILHGIKRAGLTVKS